MSEYTLAVVIFGVGVITSILLTGFILVNYFHYKNEDKIKAGEQ